MTERREWIAAYALLVLNMSIWGAHAVVARAATGNVPPMALNFWRWTLATAILLPFAWPYLRRQWSEVRAHWPMIAAAGLCSVVGFTAFYYIALNHTTTINAAIVTMSMPVMVVMMTWMAGLEFIGVRQGIGLAVSILGVAVVIAQGELGILLTLRANAGDFWMLGSMLCWGIYSVLLRRLPADLHYFTMVLAMVAVGMPVLTGLYAWEYQSTGPFALTAGNLAIVAFVVIGPAIVAYFCWMKAIRVVGANRAAMMTNLVPVIAAILAMVFLGEEPQLYHAAGFVLIFIGMYLALRGRERAVSRRAPPNP